MRTFSLGWRRLQQNWCEFGNRTDDYSAGATLFIWRDGSYLLNVGRMNHRMHQQTLGIHHDMPLLAVDLLARIITRRIDVSAAFFGAFNALAVDDAGGRTRLPASKSTKRHRT
jgi:hypothetical protein